MSFRIINSLTCMLVVLMHPFRAPADGQLRAGLPGPCEGDQCQELPAGRLGSQHRSGASGQLTRALGLCMRPLVRLTGHAGAAPLFTHVQHKANALCAPHCVLAPSRFLLAQTGDSPLVIFGKRERDTFSLDFRYPMSAHSAFAAAIASIDSKLCCAV